jgi:hypothetical protein
MEFQQSDTLLFCLLIFVRFIFSNTARSVEKSSECDVTAWGAGAVVCLSASMSARALVVKSFNLTRAALSL